MGLFFFRKEIEREQFAQRLDSLESELEKLGSKLYDLYQDAPLFSKQVEFANDLKLADEKIDKYATRQIGIERDLKALNDIKTEFQVFKSKVEKLIDFANKLSIGDNSIYQTVKRIIANELPLIIQNEVAKQIQSAKAVDKAHETNPSLANRIAKKTRYDRKSRYESTKFREHFLVAKYYKDQGLHYHEIAEKMNELGYLSARNQRFSIHAVSDLLNNSKQIRHYDSKRDLTNAIELINRKSKFIVKQPNVKVDFLHGIQ